MFARSPRLASAALAGALALSPLTAPVHAAAAPVTAPADTVRVIQVDGASNVRDIGGYTTAGGRQVRHGLVYRSASLSDVTPQGVTRLGRLGLSASVDFRSDIEILAEGPDRLPQGTEPVAAPIGFVSGAVLELMPDVLKVILADDKPGEFMALTYRNLIHDPGARQRFAATLERIASGDKAVLYHCTKGKDRTGVMTAILLTMLGVDRNQVYDDYLRSNRELADENAEQLAELTEYGIDPALVEPFLTVRTSYLDAAFDQIERDYGTFDVFLAKGLGIDAATQRAIRARLLQ